MNKFLFATLVVVALCGFNTVNAHEGEWFKVKCVFGNPNEIIVKLDKESVKTAYEIAKRNNNDNFRAHIKTTLKNIQQLNHACLLGEVVESDYNTATSMFIAGLDEFKHNADIIDSSGYPFLYLTAHRGQNYNSNHAQFTLGW